MTQKIALLFFAVCSMLFPLKAQEEYKVTIDLINVSPDKDRVKVTIITPAVHDHIVRYVLPAYLPGLPNRMDGGRFVHQYYALDEKGNPFYVRKQTENVIVMRNPGKEALHKIEYWIDDTWDDEKINPRQSNSNFSYVPQAAGTQIDPSNAYVLNFGTTLGFLEGYANLPYRITVQHSSTLLGVTAMPLVESTKSEETFLVQNYAQLLDAPMMFGALDTISFKSGNLHINIAVYSETDKIEARLLRRLLTAQVESFVAFAGDSLPKQSYSFLFYFARPERTSINRYGSYGGLDHTHSSFYFLPALTNADDFESMIRSSTSDALPQVLFTGKTALSTCQKQLYQCPALDPNDWFQTGAVIYFSMLADLRDSLISEEQFMQRMSNEVKIYTAGKKHILNERKQWASEMKTGSGARQYTSKALLTVFMLDLELVSLSAGEKSVFRFLQLHQHDDPVRFRDSCDVWLRAYGGAAIAAWMDQYVSGKKEFDLMPDFDRIGWAYAPRAIDSVLTFGNFGLIFDEKLDAFYVKKAIATNAFGLQSDDRILSVNGIVVSGDNFDLALQPIFMPRENQPVHVRFIRSQKNEEAIATPEYMVLSIAHLIRRDPDCGAKRNALHQLLLFGRS